MTMAMVTSPKRPTPTTTMITTKATTISKTISSSNMVGIIQSINSNSNRVGAIMMNRGCRTKNLVDAADPR